jgi:hypothetical protein
MASDGAYALADTVLSSFMRTLVFVTKYRDGVFGARHLERIEAIMRAGARTSGQGWPRSAPRRTMCTCW